MQVWIIRRKKGLEQKEMYKHNKTYLYIYYIIDSDNLTEAATRYCYFIPDLVTLHIHKQHPLVSVGLPAPGPLPGHGVPHPALSPMLHAQHHLHQLYKVGGLLSPVDHENISSIRVPGSSWLPVVLLCLTEWICFLLIIMNGSCHCINK